MICPAGSVTFMQHGGLGDGFIDSGKKYKKWRDEQKEINRLIEKTGESMKSFVSASADAVKLTKQLNWEEETLSNLAKKLKTSEDELLELKEKERKVNEGSLKLSSEELKQLKIDLKQSNEKVNLLAKQHAYHSNIVDSYRKQISALSILYAIRKI